MSLSNTSKIKYKFNTNGRNTVQMAKLLKDVQILDIRRISSAGESSQRYLARKFNVTQATIWRIVNNKSRYDSEVNV